MIEVIRSERLELRPLVADDADDLAELASFLGSADATELRERFERWETRESPDGSAAWLNWVVRLRDGGGAVGWVQATVDGAGAAEIAYATLAAARRRGYGLEAARAMVDWLDAPAVEAHIHPSNQASAGIARALGLHATGETHDGEVIWR